MYNRASAKTTIGTRNTHLYKDNDEIIVIEGGCPQIISQETYNTVQKRISDNKLKGGRLNAKECYLLSGKLYCSECGRAMVGNKHYCGRNKSLHVTYRCPSNRHLCANKEINRDYIDSYVISLLEKEIQKESIEQRLNNSQINENTVNIDTELILSQLQGIQRSFNICIMNILNTTIFNTHLPLFSFVQR